MHPISLDGKGNIDAVVDEYRYVISFADGLRIKCDLNELLGL